MTASELYLLQLIGNSADPYVVPEYRKQDLTEAERLKKAGLVKIVPAWNASKHKAVPGLVITPAGREKLGWDT